MTIDLPPDTTTWRRSLRDLAAVIGPAPAQRLAEAVAGVETHIPKRADPLHPLAAIIGMEAMQALVQANAAPALDLGRHAMTVVGQPSPAFCDASQLDRLIADLGGRIRALKQSE